MHAGAHRAFRAWRTAGNGLEKDAAGKAQVMLTYHLAEAHRIIRNCFEWQGVDTLTKNPPIVDSTSFRVTKMRRMPSE
jgi:hypothetical protein